MDKNIKSKLEKILYFLGLGGLVACLASPLIISASTYFPFVVGKAIAFQIAVELVLVIYLLLNLISNKYRPRFTILNWLVLGYLSAVTVSSVFGIDASFSFWSNYERMDGLFNLYHFGIYSFLLTSFLQRKKDWLMFLRFLLGTFIFVDILGFFQKVGVGYLTQFSSNRAFSTLGNATYLGAQALFQIGVAGFLFFADKKLWWRIFYIINGALGVMSIFISQTRGALMSVFVGGIIFLVLSSLFSKKRKVFVVLFGSVVVVIGLFSFVLTHSEWKITQMIPERLNIFSGNFSLETRGVVWKIALDAWKDKPIVGWGRSSSGYIFPRYYNPEAASIEDVWFDKPHNKILEVGVDSGIVGLLGYLLIFGAVVSVLWRKKESLGDGSYVLMALCPAYIVGGLFLFDFQGSYLWWFTVIGFVSFLSIKKSNKKRKRMSTSQIYAISSILIILTGTSFIVGNIRPLLAAKRGVSALKIQYQGAPANVVLPIYQSALDLNTFGNQEIITEMVKPIGGIETKLGVDHIEPFVVFAAKEGGRAYSKHPNELKNALYVASIYRMNSRFDPEYLDKAREIYKKVMEEAPKKMEVYMQLAIVEFGAQNFEAMLQYLDQGMILNRNYYKTYFETARIYFMGNMQEEGRWLLARAINMPRFPWSSLANASFLQEADVEWLVSVYERVAVVEPSWVYPDLIMGSLYGSLKNTDLMLKYFESAVSKNPNIKTSINNIFGQILK
jgi:O-antigen ligase/tetratricopeptide (TPR) repeat protein